MVNFQYDGGPADDFVPPPSKSKFVYVMTVLSAIGGFLFGYDTGVVSGAMILIRDKFALDTVWQELIVSVTIGGAWLFSIVGGPLSDKFGRKATIILASVLFTAGAIVMGVATGKEMLLVGRIVVGAGVGLASTSVPVYIGEVAPSNVRGSLVTYYQIFITLGFLVANIVDGLFSKNKVDGWRYMLGLAGVPSVIQFFGFLFMPESPRWLVSQKKDEHAISVLKRIRGGGPHVDHEYDIIKKNCEETERAQSAPGSSKFVIVEIFKTPNVRRALMVGCALQMFQQIAGINTVMYYTASIFEMTGVNKNLAIWLGSVTSSVNFLFSFVGLALVERLGRRILILSSMAGVIISLCVIGIGFQLADLNSPAIESWDMNTANSSCFNFTYCAGCTNNRDCGFCYEKINGSLIGSCLLSTNNGRTSTSGQCSVDDPPDGFIWSFNSCPTDYSWIVILGMCLYLCSFAPGLGPMPWTVNAEIYPSWARSTCYAISTSVNWICNLVIAMTFLEITIDLTKQGAFWLYMCLGILGWLIFFFTLPETKGRSLEEVEKLFSRPYWKYRKEDPERMTLTLQEADLSGNYSKQ